MAQAEQRTEATSSAVTLGVEWVTLRRAIGGFEAQVNVPTSSYRGVTLRSVGVGRGYEIALLHLDPGLDVVLTACDDDAELIALWRGYARDLALPLLIEDSDGRLQPVSEGVGTSPHPRRRGSPLRHRRSRFMARRRPGQTSAFNQPALR